MIIIGITGSIGMGKTTVSNMFKILRIPVFDSDQKVKEILEQNGKFPVKVSWELNYHEMKDITEKFVWL